MVTSIITLPFFIFETISSVTIGAKLFFEMQVKLTDEQWQKILPVLKSFPEIRLGAGRDCRRFLEAVLWITRSGSQWRLLPKQYGKWNSVFKRFNRWSELKVFDKLFEHFSGDRDLEYLLIDSTIVRAHACSSGAQKNTATRL